jgi:NADPH:quinone reductase-like Zn-dependent oxidoreductase
MLAVLAVRTDPADPLAGLAVAERDEPRAPEGWELVRVVAAALNYHDIATLQGVGVDPGRLPIVLGTDAAGVTEDGREVIVHSVISSAPGASETLAPDFSILSERYDGTMAGRVAVPRRNLVDKPTELSFEEAACLPTAWLTTYRALFTQAGVQPGDTVLVQGAGGGVATAATLLGRAGGFRVWVTSRSEAKRARALEIGAHGAFEPGARLPERVHAVIDTVGEATWSHSLKALVPGGTLVTMGATSGSEPPADLKRIFYRQLRVIGSTMGTREELAAMVRMLLVTGVRPVIDSVLPLPEAAEGFRRMASGQLFGKVVLLPDPAP